MKTLGLILILLATPAFAHDEGLLQTMESIAEDAAKIQLELHMISVIANFMDKDYRFSGPFVIERIEPTQDGLHFTEGGYVVSITVYGTSNRSRSYLLLIRDDTILASQSIPLINEEGCSS